jgi:EGF-like domain
VSVGPSAWLTAAFGVLAVILPGSGPSGQLAVPGCNGHGHTQIGRCFCDPGWYGAQCGSNTPDQPRDCGAHGRASNGWCVCEPGWKGGACQTPPLACTHGKVARGKCVCDAGWSGAACNTGSQ